MSAGLVNAIKKLTIGAMRHRVTIAQPADSDDGAGGMERHYNPVETVWASIQPLSMDRAVMEGRAAQLSTHRIIMRWRNDIDTASRITSDARIFHVHAIADADAMRRYLAVLVEEVRP
ncbi:MAG: phage head closure protein [Beijerinckiaceae bacterium]